MVFTIHRQNFVEMGRSMYHGPPGKELSILMVSSDGGILVSSAIFTPTGYIISRYAGRFRLPDQAASATSPTHRSQRNPPPTRESVQLLWLYSNQAVYVLVLVIILLPSLVRNGIAPRVKQVAAMATQATIQRQAVKAACAKDTRILPVNNKHKSFIRHFHANGLHNQPICRKISTARSGGIGDIANPPQPAQSAPDTRAVYVLVLVIILLPSLVRNGIAPRVKQVAAMATQATIQRQAVKAACAKDTRILPVRSLNVPGQSMGDIERRWEAEKDQGSPEAQALLEAAEALRTSDTPVAFPTETVYGLGADATRSAAVQGIYRAKQRPSDNPLIVHVSSREQLEPAPSANASTKPSPTTAQHVYADLHGRIDIILDGGPCGVGVESTVVDGLNHPPAILRPGGVGIEEIRACRGWEDVRVGYKDGALPGKMTPRAPGMKYRHYSPRAKVVLFETSQEMPSVVRRILNEQSPSSPLKIGVIRTKTWQKGLTMRIQQDLTAPVNGHCDAASSSDLHDDIPSSSAFPLHRLSVVPSSPDSGSPPCTIDMLDVFLGHDLHCIARGLFSALRSLDENDVSTIYVEGIADTDGDLAAAIMNRLRKAAEEEIKS
ncbi:SUA5 protein [Coccidioides immitis H538.4]|uniref:Threonylcarbamoyl-AMP synthase n=1 Tax=Coccidioides immitis H538.4 TaxID=396776 RepID=A0A0J8RFR2_COCIT|nr:SUA5 protein [Coccidioides immitis H538.4]